MLRSLYISNYALITELNIGFESGFSVITGETGAGKSIILGALSLILGQRADTKAIKIDADKCIIEAEFDITKYVHLDSFFSENDIENDRNSCLIRREITNTGKSRAFVNDSPVSLNVVRELSSRLIDIHSQHENLLLSNDSYQLEVVDTIAQNSAIIADYKIAFSNWKSIQTELKQLQNNALKQAGDIDFIQFQFNQLSEANLMINEQAELESEQNTLSHAEEIKSALFKVNHLMEDEQMSLQLLNECITTLSHVKTHLPEGEQWYDRINSAFIDLKDLMAEISGFSEQVDFNPGRLEWVDARLSELFTLQKKYKVNSVSELIDLRNSFESQLLKIDSFDEELELLKIKLGEAFELLNESAIRLTNSRREAISPIESFLVDQLSKLGMPNIQFNVALSNLSEYSDSGYDEVQFLFSANKNRPVQPVTQIASGGEVSRFMLSIKSLIAHKADLPTIIFDEIDTGVSGEIANRMGEIMQNMSDDMQVITITHLPQIAAKGKQHYRVFKDDSGTQTVTHIERLAELNRVTELAQMLSGKNITDAALKNAKELLISR